MSLAATRRLAAALLAATGVIHLVLVPEYLEEQTYLGVLFILGGLAALAVAASLARVHDSRLWATGGLLSAGMGIGFVLSRTVGLPGFHESEWELSGILTLALEGSFLILAARAVASAQRHGRPLGTAT